jgi:hypothetical protein
VPRSVSGKKRGVSPPKMGISHKNVGIYQENVGVIFAMAVKFYKKTLAEKDTRTYVFFFNLKNW